MTKKEAQKWFLKNLQKRVESFAQALLDAKGDWVVKGFIDIFERIYTISADTKVVSKLIELMLFPYFEAMASEHELEIVPCREQNHYPDLTFVHKEGWKFAVDLKSTYRHTGTECNGGTLGTFTGYFRNRESSKGITFPYNEYAGHYAVGVIYSRTELTDEQFRTWSVKELKSIPSVVKDLEFFAQPKYRIASDHPGSGNTKNIGAVNSIEALVKGEGPFAKLGEKLFDDYWMNYLTKEMARAAELTKQPYRNLAEYKAFKNIA
ncbi:MAG TPA: type II restriction endonuclease [Candidatus Kapabacteria bacterium]|nr:type II restriction endonuclease [Candidatus Kapabacteria bacterium]